MSIELGTFWVAKKRWLEFSITVNGELAEAVAESVSRYAANGIVVENAVEYPNGSEVAQPVDLTKVVGYLPIDETLNEKRHLLEEAIWHLSQVVPLPEPSFKVIKEQDWMEAWKDNYHPIPIGEKMLILPAWFEQVDDERIAIRINPGMAFGTGTHPTTQLCIWAFEKYLQPGQTVIDVGCGSGILSIGALLLGAEQALGVDIDPESVRSSHENGELNKVNDKMIVAAGSVSDILANKFEYNQAPVVLANILAVTIIQLFEDGLSDLVSQSGCLILSGILIGQVGDVMAKASQYPLELVEKLQKEDWVALVYKRN